MSKHIPSRSWWVLVSSAAVFHAWGAWVLFTDGSDQKFDAICGGILWNLAIIAGHKAVTDITPAISKRLKGSDHVDNPDA